jgi:PAS domain S-box-containing protein
VAERLTDFDAYWSIHESNYAVIASAAYDEIARTAPAFVDGCRLARVREPRPDFLPIVRRSVGNGDWHPVDAFLADRGETLTALDVSIDEWIEVMMLHLRHTVPHLVRELDGDRARLSGAIVAMQDFWTRCILVARRGYIAAREAAVRTDREALARSERLFRAIVETSAEALNLATRDGTIIYSSPMAFHYTGRPPEAYVGTKVFDHVVAEEVAAYRRGWEEFVDRPGARLRTEFSMRTNDGKLIHLETLRSNLLDDPNLGAVVSIVRDITDQRRVEEHMRQTQKMEAVGRLAGGVAHDFNNLLSVIVSYAEVAAGGLPKDDPVRDDLAEILQAAERGAGLTRQLLAFGRKQVMQLQSLDLNELVEDFGKMLRRLIGEDIEFEIRPSSHLFRTRADRGQIEQVLMNLVVNARDAMPNGGRLVVSTANAMLDAAQAAQFDLTPGPYVVLSVSDTGSGMDAPTLARVFEPFFTTKRVGEGTGLGLSTAYGIVRQSGGAIAADSAPGTGTVFRIYLQQNEGTDERHHESGRPRHSTGRETLLVVEDEEPLRKVLVRILSGAGYTVFVAASPEEAVHIAATAGRDVHLVLTDVILPTMNGRELVERLRTLCPSTVVLFMSGYTDESIERLDVLGNNFLRKPFSQNLLMQKVRETLDAAEEP